MSGGSTTTQTTTANNSPWEPSQNYLKGTMSAASQLYNSGVGAQPYTGSTVIPFSTQTMAGMGDITNQAAANMNGAGLSGQAQDIINAGGYNPAQQQSMEYLSGAGTNPFDLSGNSAYQSYKQNALGDVRDMVNASAMASGRYGSGDHTGRQINELSNAATNMDMAQFARLDDLNSQRFNAGQQGMNNLDTAYGLGQRGATDMMSIGGMYEDLAGRLKNDELRIFNEYQNLPWENLARANAIYSGAGSMGGTQTQTAQVPGQNPFLTGLGYATTGAGLLGSLF